MSIRIGNDFLKIPEIAANGVQTTRNISKVSNTKTSNTTSAFASELSSSIAALNATGSNNLLLNSLSGVYPNLNYNVFDATSVSQSYWGRNDFPLEALFNKGNASSILNWIPQGIEPASDATSVLNRLTPTLGMKAIVISPELESKFNTNPQFAQDVMNTISEYIKDTDGIFSGKEKSDALILDGNGKISHYRTFVEDTGLIKPSEIESERKKIGNNIRITNPMLYRF